VRHLARRPWRAFRAGIVDGDVEPAEPRVRAVDKRAHLILVPDIGLDERSLGAERAQLGFER